MTSLAVRRYSTQLTIIMHKVIIPICPALQPITSNSPASNTASNCSTDNSTVNNLSNGSKSWNKTF